MKKTITELILLVIMPMCVYSFNTGKERIEKKDLKIQRSTTPMMGWSSWNTFRVNINEALIKETTDALLRNGLKEVGYNYINIDDGFFGGRRPDGKLFANAKFPNGLRGISDYIHSKGLFAGIYSDAGANTCGSIYDKDTLGIGVGLWKHEKQDFDLYFNEWNFDFIKIDFCGGAATGKTDKERYTEIYDAMKRTGRNDIRFNICRWQFPGTWVTRMADSWRISTDIRPNYKKIDEIIETNLYLAQYASVGHYNDMDMLEMGRGLSNDEEKTHFGIWSIMSSPLMIGCDLRTINPSTLEIIKNQEVIALNQDTLGLQAHVVNRGEGYLVLAKDIEKRNGNIRAVALYNRSEKTSKIRVNLKDLNLTGKALVRDLWLHKDLGKFSNYFETDVAPHSTIILRIEGEGCTDRMVYEAEYAFMNGYNPDKKDKAHAAKKDNTSGNVIMKYLGGSESNWADIQNVNLSQDGNYKIKIHYLSGENRDLQLIINGKEYWLKNLVGSWNEVSTTEITTRLNKGNNVIRLSNPSNWAPDIDKIELIKMKK